MNNQTIKFIKIDRSRFAFRNREVSIVDEEGLRQLYPCIVLVDLKLSIVVKYTGLERYIWCSIDKNAPRGTYLNTYARIICSFLTWMITETQADSINFLTEADIRQYLLYIKKGKDGKSVQPDTWNRYANYTLKFLKSYYDHNKNNMVFNYNGERLIQQIIKRDTKNRLKINYEKAELFNVAPPQSSHKRNRMLVEEYLPILLETAKEYDPELVLMIALGAYGGIRSGELVNIKNESVICRQSGYATIRDITIDLTQDAAFFADRDYKSEPGHIKKYRVQPIYDDFREETAKLLNEHLARHEGLGVRVDKEAPLFVNKQGRPMTAQTFRNRLRTLFRNHFIPKIKNICEQEGTLMENIAFIEAYEEEYPGAHMLRHWFTMYLLIHLPLSQHSERSAISLIAKWRGDESEESMNTYIHENSRLIEIYRASAYAMEEELLEAAKHK